MDQDQDKKVQFLPFHALNEFMTTEYRLEVVRAAITVLPDLPENLRNPIDRLTKKAVVIPGFRNSIKAPSALKIKPVAQAFEKNPHLVAAILAVWAEKNHILRQQMYDLLIGRGWELLPVDADRTRLPGFITVWPKGEDFDVLNADFREKYPELEASENDVSLMAVWMSGRLPYRSSDEDGQNPEPPGE